MTKYYSKWRKGMKKAKNGKYYYPKKRNYQNNRKRNYRRSTAQMVISRPLLPMVQKVCLKYYTRFHIDPLPIQSGATATAHNLPIHTFAWNDAYDIDKTHSLTLGLAGATTGRQQDGAPDHQPRMYDEYGQFYDKITVIGAKANITFSNANRTMLTSTDTVTNLSTGAHTESISSSREVEPLPSFVGLLNSQYNDKAVVADKWDNLREKNEVRFRRLQDHDNPVRMTAKWSLKKDNVYRSKLPLMTDAEAPENYTAEWNHSPHNLRFLHLFACPITVSNSSNPAPIDVEVEISQICLLSDRKDIAQS